MIKKHGLKKRTNFKLVMWTTSQSLNLFVQMFPFISVLSSSLNQVLPNAPFLYTLKTSENLTVFWCFQGIEKGCTRYRWVEHLLRILESTEIKSIDMTVAAAAWQWQLVAVNDKSTEFATHIKNTKFFL